MTTEPNYEQIITRLDRVIDLLEDLRTIRRARTSAETTTMTDHEPVYTPTRADE